MDRAARAASARVISVWWLPLLGALLLASPPPGASAASSPRVKVSVSTKAQGPLLRTGRLAVRVSSAGRAKIRLRGGQGKRLGLLAGRGVTFRRAGTKRVALRLRPAGRERLGRCGAQAVVVVATYRHRGRRVTTRGKRRLRRAPSRCPIHVDAPNADRCDPIDQAACLLPFPNDHYTVEDPSAATGLRVNLDPESMPANDSGLPVDPAEANRNDGFSPNNAIVARVPGIETPEAFRANGIVPQIEIGAYADPDQRVLLIDAETGERHPIWAELDMVPEDDDDRLLIVHPAAALDYGSRYIVALRNLTGAEGEPLTPAPVFAAYRNGRATDNERVEERRPQIERIFDELAEAGVAREELYLAWDFTVASEESLTGRLLAIRDDAFAQLGDPDLADGAIDGAAPEVNDVAATAYGLCEPAGAPCGGSESSYAFKRVTGTITVPCYMDAPGDYNPGDPDTPCAAGSRLHYEAGAETPSQNGDATWEAPFTCIVPRTGAGEEEMATGKPGIVFGHGLLGSHTATGGLRLVPASLETVACGTDWIGLSEGDLPFLINMLALKRDLSLFSAIPDRSQQGYVNALYLARAMAHPEGLAGEPELQDAEGNPVLEVDPTDTARDLGYFGVSLGGIFGAATTSVAPGWERAALSVPGMGFTTLLTRSTQFNQFLPLVYGAYPDELERQIGISTLQLTWDRGEPSAYIHRLTDESFANTPAHRVLIHQAFGDHQVANVQTETMARTLDAAVRIPRVAPGRTDSVDYVFADAAVDFWTDGQELVDSDGFNQPGGWDGPAALFTFDTGPIRTEGDQIVGTNPNPDWNIAPVGRSGGTPNDGLDPHGPVATSPSAQHGAVPFLLGQGAYDPCVSEAPSPLDMPPWTVPYEGAPSPCFAPPLPEPGQGQ